MSEKESSIKIVVIDDDTKSHSTLITKLKVKFDHVILFNTPDDAVEYIGNNPSSKTIIILDIDLGEEYKNGYLIFNEIREKSALIEVILYTARDNPKDFQKKIEEVIGNRAFAYVVKKTGSEEILINTVLEARDKILLNIEVALEEWIEVKQRDKRKDKSYEFHIDGITYSLEVALSEIRKQSLIGEKIEREITMLAIDLLTQKKSDTK